MVTVSAGLFIVAGFDAAAPLTLNVTFALLLEIASGLSTALEELATAP
jgi:hypothetical protein